MSEGTVTSADGTTIAYTAWGAGDPIVIIDGATAYRATNPLNRETAELLAGEFLVINYDRRGRGESGDTLPYAVEREFEDLAAIIEQAGQGRPATVFGWSSGGNLALNAAHHGGPITRVAVFEPNAAVDDARPPLPGDYVERLDAAIADGRPGDAVALFMTAAVMLPDEAVAGMREMDFWAGLEAVAPTIAYDGRQVGDALAGRPLRPGLWKNIDVPVLVMYGADTWPALAAGSRAIAAHLPASTLEPVPGEEHSTTADVLAAALRAFIKEN
ncbi:alpha/beta hydrolase [Actinoplanes italicus]|uniref:Pimeloyl-ACP methyl ester carboxylesterase n=1 Tax=Actinoplanes italicus TaxID=113567 RepID=A0A2T0JEA8_9ACTN|nr:alpha/beta hydrolase [Actinoplanes italicus]PRX05983.1 pimeloyl-ACP methyl ester carboxylesterase [Actinoplanes italicus]GIE36851.1 alpha/beta hydrolase [Actinoplanes italicus]